MAAQTYSITFDGYWREQNKSGLPNNSGIYCVYSCIYNTAAKNVSLQKLIYIGEAENVRDRVANHEKTPLWKRHLRQGEELCFSSGLVPGTSRVRCEAAMIHEHKPPVNVEYVDKFPFDQTTMELSGTTALLTTRFTVYRKD